MTEIGYFRVEGTVNGPEVTNFSGSVGTSYGEDGAFGVIFYTANSHTSSPKMVITGNKFTNPASKKIFSIYGYTDLQVKATIDTSNQTGFASLNLGDYVEFTISRD